MQAWWRQSGLTSRTIAQLVLVLLAPLGAARAEDAGAPASVWTKDAQGALVYLEAGGEKATGFIVKSDRGPYYVLTAAHALFGVIDPTIATPDRPAVPIGVCQPVDEKLVAIRQGNTGGDWLFATCIAYLGGPDLAAIKLKPSGHGLPSLRLGRFRAETDRTLSLLGFRAGLALQETPEVAQLDDVQDGPRGSVLFRAANAGGLSGAPYMSARGVVVGLHSGVLTDTKPMSGFVAMVPLSSAETLLTDMGLLLSDTPAAKSVAAALLLKKIYNPPRGPDASDTTVWLGAEGSEPIIVDGIRIHHIESNLMSGHTGVLLPLARFNFNYEPGSDRLYPLDPALVIDPDDRQDVSFVLNVQPKAMVSGASQVEIQLIYRSQSGATHGKLFVQEAPADQVRLSHLLERSFYVDDTTFESPVKLGDRQVVTPDGTQRMASTATGTPLAYTGVWLPDLQRVHELVAAKADIPAFAESFVPASDRELAAAVLSSGHLDDIVTLVRSNDALGFSMCALLGAQCRGALVANPSASSERDGYYLTLSHLVAPSVDLERFVSQRAGAAATTDLRDALATLLLRPTPTSTAAIAAAARQSPDAMEALYAGRVAVPEGDRAGLVQASLETIGRTNLDGRSITNALRLLLYVEAPTDERLRDVALRLKVSGARDPDAISTMMAEVVGPVLLANLTGSPLRIAEGFGYVVWPSADLTRDDTIIDLGPFPGATADGVDDTFGAAVGAKPADFGARSAPGRADYWRRLSAGGLLPKLEALARLPGPVALSAVELLADADDAVRYRAFLISLCGDPEKSATALRSLARIHLRAPSPDLADAYLNRCVMHEGVSNLEVASALWARRVGHWDMALVKSVVAEPDNYIPIELLNDAREQLSPEALRAARKLLALSVTDIPPGAKFAAWLRARGR